MRQFQAFFDQHRGAATAATLALAVVLVLTAGVVAVGLIGEGPMAAASPIPTSSSAASPTSASSSAPLPADCVNPPVDLTSLIEVADPVACYGNASLTVDATWWGDIMGRDCEPVWLACRPYRLQPPGDTREVGAPQLDVALHPSASISIPAEPGQVRVTGHFDDLAARACREPVASGGAESLAPVAVSIESCRRTFVVTRVVPLAIGAPDVLTADSFAHVIARIVNVRTEPGLDAPTVSIPQGGESPLLPALLGTAGGSEHVFILEGPVTADGFEWYRVAPIEYEAYRTVGPLFIGWVAAGDGVDPWLVAEDPCPAGPLTLDDFTYTSTTTNWATRLGCFRKQEFTLRGWYPEYELPPGIGFECYDEPAFLMCNFGLRDIRPIEMSYDDGRNANRLDFALHPDSGAVPPSRGQWIEITGHWDDPASTLCPTDSDLGTLFCRMQFVVTAITPLGAAS